MAGRKKEDTLVAEKRGVKKYVHPTYMGYHFLLRKNRRVVSCCKKQQQINSKLKKEQHSFTMYMAALQCSNGVSLSNMAGRKKKKIY